MLPVGNECMSSDDGISEDADSTTNRPTKYDTDRSQDPDIDLSYDEARAREDFVFAHVYTTEGRASDTDKGMLRTDYDAEGVEYALMIRKGETGCTKIKASSITKIDLGRDESTADDSGVL